MTTSRSWTLVAAGYSLLLAGMLAFLTVNGISSTAGGASSTAGFLVLGFLSAAMGMLALTRRMDTLQRTLRIGLVLQSLCMIGLLIGLAVSFVASSLSGHLVSAAFVVPSGVTGLAGAVLISKVARASQLVIGAALIAVGAALIPAANIAQYEYLMLSIDKNVYQDIGATIAACGCVVAAYSCFVLRRRGNAPAVSRS